MRNEVKLESLNGTSRKGIITLLSFVFVILISHKMMLAAARMVSRGLESFYPVGLKFLVFFIQLFFIQKQSSQKCSPIQNLSSFQSFELKQSFLVIHRKGSSLSITTIFKYKLLLNKAYKYFWIFLLYIVWIKLLITTT